MIKAKKFPKIPEIFQKFSRNVLKKPKNLPQWVDGGSPAKPTWGGVPKFSMTGGFALTPLLICIINMSV